MLGNIRSHELPTAEEKFAPLSPLTYNTSPSPNKPFSSPPDFGEEKVVREGKVINFRDDVLLVGHVETVLGKRAMYNVAAYNVT